MQGLSWWLYEADVVAYTVMEETGQKAGMALPPSFFSARSQRGLLALSGPSATLHVADRAGFVRRFVEVRFWLLQLGVVLQRTAVDPQPHCDSPWIPSAKGSDGYRGKWYTPGWPWPFKNGVGVVVGNCTYPQGATTPQPVGECCSVIFGQLKGAKCLETAHHMVLEQTLASHADAPGGPAATLALSSAISADGVVDLHKVRALGAEPAALAPVLFVELPTEAARGGPLPRLAGFTPAERAAIDELLHDECREMLNTLPPA